MAKKINLKDIIKSLAVLTAICIASSVLLVVGDKFLKPDNTASYDAKVIQGFLTMTAEGFEGFEDIAMEEEIEGIRSISRVVGGAHDKAIIFRNEYVGFDGGNVEMLVSVKDGEIVGAYILGADPKNSWFNKVEPNKTEAEAWFVGKTSIKGGTGEFPEGEELAVVTKSGASVTCGGFVNCAKLALEHYNANKDALLAAEGTMIDLGDVKPAVNWKVPIGELSTEDIAKLKAAGFVNIDDSTKTIPNPAVKDFTPAAGATDAQLTAREAELNDYKAKIFGVWTLADFKNAQLIIVKSGDNRVAYLYDIRGKVESVEPVVLAGAANDTTAANAASFHTANVANYPAPILYVEAPLTDEVKQLLIDKGVVTSTTANDLKTFRVDFTPATINEANSKAALDEIDEFEEKIEAVYQLGANKAIIIGKSGNTMVALTYTEGSDTPVAVTITVDTASVAAATSNATAFYTEAKATLFGAPNHTWTSGTTGYATRLAELGYTVANLQDAYAEFESTDKKDEAIAAALAVWKYGDKFIALIEVAQSTGYGNNDIILLIEFNATGATALKGFDIIVDEPEGNNMFSFIAFIKSVDSNMNDLIGKTNVTHGEIDAVAKVTGDHLPEIAIAVVNKANKFVESFAAGFFVD